MKLFNTVQELWDYCLLCPVCAKEREMDISIGPESSFELNSFQKILHILELDTTFTNRLTVYNIKYRINCLGNTFETAVLESRPIVADRHQSDPERAAQSYFYFYIQAFCRHCKQCSSVHSMDIEPDISAGTLSNFGLERESFYLLKTEDKFHLTFIHDRNVMLVSKFYDDGECCVESEKCIELPLVKIDLIDQEKAAHRLKTLILFS